MFQVDFASTTSRRDAPIPAKSRNTLLVRVLRVLHAHVRATNVTKISSTVCSVARQSATRTVPRKATSTLSRSRTIFQLKFRRSTRVNVRSFLLTAWNARARVWLHHKNVHVAPIYLDKNKSEQRSRRGEERREGKRREVRREVRRERETGLISLKQISEIQRSRLLSGFTKRADLPPTN